ncbi:hypothetical protein PF003_g25283 [Phytophthora fragariae]|nr:hypothetical protein PF003_g25283 [Phytophthora fragariae]
MLNRSRASCVLHFARRCPTWVFMCLLGPSNPAASEDASSSPWLLSRFISRASGRGLD